MADETKTTKEKGFLSLMAGAAGIYLSYVLLAIYSQKLYSEKFQSNVEFNSDGTPVSHSFKHPSLLVWLSGLCCAIFGKFRSLAAQQKPNPISIKQSIILGILFAVNMASTNFALLYISYPTQVIARNSRYLFVVFVGTFLSRVPTKHDLKLPRHKLYVAIFITTGVLLFNFSKSTASDPADHHLYPEEWKGYTLLLISLVADALFCDNQAYVKVQFKPTANNLFVAANFWAFVFCALYALLSDTFLPALQFIIEHPLCMKQLGIVCILQVTGQVSIYYIIANFKQHIFPLISATRKIITIVCSIFLFGHVLNIYQWVAVSIVFIGMTVQVYDEVNEKKKKEKQALKKAVAGQIERQTNGQNKIKNV